MPQWVLELIMLVGVAGAAVGAFWIYHHHVYGEGIHAQQVADQKASAKVIAQAEAKTKAALETAQKAHDAYLQEVSNEAIAVARNPLPAVRLCLNSYGGHSRVPQTGTAHAGNENSGTPFAGISSLPAGNHPVRTHGGPNIAGLLELLAGRADQVSAELREYQARTQP